MTAKDWVAFQLLAVAHFKETRSRPFGELQGRTGLGVVVHTRRLIDNHYVLRAWGRILNQFIRIKAIKTNDVHCTWAEIKPGDPAKIEVSLTEEELPPHEICPAPGGSGGNHLGPRKRRPLVREL